MDQNSLLYVAKNLNSYLKRLETQSRLELRLNEPSESNQGDASQAMLTPSSRPSSQGASAERDIVNPLRGSGALLQQQFIGESTCTVFAGRLLQSLQHGGNSTPTVLEQSYVNRPEFARQMGNSRACKFPDRIRANLLVRVALRFIGQDYHFFLHKEFLLQLEKVYMSKDAQDADPAWTCKFFVVLALGELYSGTLPSTTTARNVPGTDYFVNAVLLLQDTYEEPSLTQIEIMLLFVSPSISISSLYSL
jgi:proline utilization trans-activator